MTIAPVGFTLSSDRVVYPSCLILREPSLQQEGFVHYSEAHVKEVFPTLATIAASCAGPTLVPR